MKKINKKAYMKGVEAQKPIVVYKCKNYIIETIPLNYRITILVKKKKRGCKTIDRDLYVDLDENLLEAKEWAEDYIDKYFIR